MPTTSLGSQGLTVSRQGLGCMGMSEFYGPATTRSRSPRSSARSTSASPSSTRPTCTARSRTRSSSAARSPAAATRSCSRRSSPTCAARTARSSASAATPGVRQGRVRGVAAAARRRPHRPLLPAPRRPADADRGDRRRDGRARRGGQGPLPRPVRGGARDDPPRARRAPDLGAADRVLGLGARAGGRDPADAARAGHRLRALQPARPRLPHRAPCARSTTLAEDDFRRFQPRFQGDNLEANVAIVERIDELARGARRDARADRARLGPRPGRGRRPDPGHQARAATSRRTPPRSTSSSAPTDARDARRRRPGQRATATRTCRRRERLTRATRAAALTVAARADRARARAGAAGR